MSIELHPRRRSAIADPGGRTVVADEEEGTEEEDGGAGDTAGAVVVAVLTLGWRVQWRRRRGPDPMHAAGRRSRSRGTKCLLLSCSCPFCCQLRNFSCQIDVFL